MAILLGPLWFIKKRQYSFALLALLLQLMLPLQLTLLVHWQAWQSMLSATQQVDIMRGLCYNFVAAYYYAVIASPLLVFLTLVVAHFALGYLGRVKYKHYLVQLKKHSHILPKDDNLGTLLVALGFLLTAIFFLLAGVPYEHAFFPEQADQFYTYEEAIRQLNRTLLGGFAILSASMLYPIVRIVIASKR